ncbi:TetR/AcrR family transcriptional regulator [Lysinibacillus sp. MHQ-1]|nr:TetR/AcrR family transcriptional regulator [Lysinibacillus sp. MHQ-1]
MWKYFVDATAEIIEEEGLENVTIRKVADKAGYNSATIYNYFSEISHLLFFASMRCMQDYTNEVARYIERGKDPIDKYLLAWECFCQYSFKQPQIFSCRLYYGFRRNTRKNYWKIIITFTPMI